jgi:hypothetical protein
MSSRAPEECKKVRVLGYLLERAVEKSLKIGKKKPLKDGHVVFLFVLHHAIGNI